MRSVCDSPMVGCTCVCVCVSERRVQAPRELAAIDEKHPWSSPPCWQGDPSAQARAGVSLQALVTWSVMMLRHLGVTASDGSPHCFAGCPNGGALSVLCPFSAFLGQFFPDIDSLVGVSRSARLLWGT